MPSKTKQIRINNDLHYQVKLRSFQTGMTIGEYTETALHRQLADRVIPTSSTQQKKGR